MKKLVSLIICLSIVVTSCSTKSDNNSTSNENYSDENSYQNSDNEEPEEYNDDECGFEDGTYSATVDYYNPETDYSNTYTLDVEVEDCQVIQINFPAGGWLDSDHISPGDLDENGFAYVDGEDGKTYEIQIDY